MEAILAERGVALVEDSPLDQLLAKSLKAEPEVPEGYRLLQAGEYRVRVNVDFMHDYAARPLVVISDDGREIECDDVLVLGQCQFACSKTVSGCGGHHGSVRLTIPSTARVAVLD